MMVVMHDDDDAIALSKPLDAIRYFFTQLCLFRLGIRIHRFAATGHRLHIKQETEPKSDGGRYKNLHRILVAICVK